MSSTARIGWISVMILGSLVLLPVRASAQFGGYLGGGREGTVSGTAVSTIEKQPDVMRMHIELMAKAGSLKEALKALSERKAAARQSIERLGAEMETVKFGQTSISSSESEQQRQMAQMMSRIEQQRGRTGRAKETKTSVPITVSCSLTVDWKLGQESVEDLLLFVHPLQQELRDADLSGAKDVSKLTPEQEEMMEEMQSEYGFDYYSSDEEEPGTPIFTFVAGISDEEYNQALADAFQRAKKDAARLSQATGSELGKLVSVSSSSEEGTEAAYSPYYEEQYYLSQRLQAIGASQAESANEATSVRPGPVQKLITVTAWFDFKE